MKKLLPFLLISVWLLNLSEGRRISEEKCEEYSKLSPISTIRYPHMVQVFLSPAPKDFYPKMGVLISDEYVLTHAVKKVIGARYQVSFTGSEKFDVVDVYPHPYNDGTPYHDIALLKLEYKMQLDGNHRPACLWTEDQINDTIAILMEWPPLNGDFSTSRAAILTEEQCSALDSKYNASIICLNPEGEDNDTQLWSTKGGPIQLKLSGVDGHENYYILGILSSIFSNVVTNRQIASKTRYNLDWIEKIVWLSTNNNCGRVQVKPPTQNTPSTSVFYGEFPWHAAIYRLEGRFKRHYICGGVILNPNTIITSASCLVHGQDGVLANQLIVSVGRHSLNSTSTSTRDRQVSEVILHEYFVETGQIRLTNIALLKLRDVIVMSDYVEPICLTDNLALFNADSGIVAGWGRTQSSILGGIITKASLSIASEEDCENIENVPPNGGTFCATYHDETSVCSGDKGSGLVFENFGNWYLRGIVSWPVNERCDPGELVLLTDVVYFYDWIINKL